MKKLWPKETRGVEICKRCENEQALCKFSQGLRNFQPLRIFFNFFFLRIYIYTYIEDFFFFFFCYSAVKIGSHAIQLLQ